MSSEPKIRFGIMGCADIAKKVSRAISLAPNAELSAVASRTLEKATAFAAANNFPPDAKVYGSYEALLDDPEIDAVYIPLPTTLHLKWASLAAQKKKHVLLEKPVAVSVPELDQILAACEANGVQFMDGTMWLHHPRTAKMKEFLTSEDGFGELRTVHSCLSFPADEWLHKDNIRLNPDLDSLGALGDVGWYCAYSILWAADYELPKTVIATPGAVISEAGVILACGASLRWEDGKSATFHCSFLAKMESSITAVGTKGPTLEVNDYVIPIAEKEASFVASSSQHVVPTDIPQEACLIRELSRLVGEIKVNGGKPDLTWASRSRKTQRVLDAVKESIDNGFQPVEIGN
ncbi:unnamed protein product [Linum trigynum]|uniref:Gfo/Idh/MocA-like oxidoreductase N-terminal domain-containing protein n=1 Tax=Linum trigynum TaxID=586398 RepID=A0AAV2CLR8_9ROSI